MKNTVPYFITLLIIFSSCKKEEETADFYCKVNGEKWMIYNSKMLGTGLSARLNGYNPKTLYLNLYSPPKDEGLLQELAIVVMPFDGNTSYSNHQFGCSAFAKGRDGNDDNRTFYGLDTTQPADITILRHDDNDIAGTFNFTLISFNRIDPDEPEKIVITDGRFQCDLEAY